MFRNKKDAGAEIIASRSITAPLSSPDHCSKHEPSSASALLQPAKRILPVPQFACGLVPKSKWTLAALTLACTVFLLTVIFLAVGPALLGSPPSDRISSLIGISNVKKSNSSYSQDLHMLLARACDHYAHSGHLSIYSHLWLAYDLDFSYAAASGSAESAASPQHACQQRIRAQPTDHLRSLSAVTSGGASLPSYLRNRLVLVVGDSNDRYTSMSLCESIGGVRVVVDKDGSEPTEDSCRTQSQLCTVRDGSGAVFAWLSVFQVGVEMVAGRKNNFEGSTHCENGFPVDIRDRLKWIPALLAGAAKRHFPEICARDGVPGCGDAGSSEHFRRHGDDARASFEAAEPVVAEEGRANNDGGAGIVNRDEGDAAIDSAERPTLQPPAGIEYFPVPDLVIAESALWDIREWHLYQQDYPWDEITMVPGLLQSWVEKFLTRLMSPLRSVLDEAVRRKMSRSSKPIAEGSVLPAENRVPLMIRTCPLPTFGHARFPPHIVETLNMLIHDLAARASDERWRYPTTISTPPAAAAATEEASLFRGVLDWARLVRGVNSHLADGFHQDNRSTLAFAQMVMSEVELIDLERSWQSS
ncbi:hypothetical protein HK405_007656 [Cladochytrium tenue]|nr:hypothetical protein HK405_007656 [Cladochytrium tenue]